MKLCVEVPTAIYVPKIYRYFD